MFYFSQANARVGCALTHPSISVVLRRDFAKTKGVRSTLIEFSFAVSHFASFQVVVANSQSRGTAEQGWTFHDYSGFLLKNVDSWLLAGDYMCIAKRTTKLETDKSSIQYARFQIIVGGRTVLL